jgi:hypothetical protein
LFFHKVYFSAFFQKSQGKSVITFMVFAPEMLSLAGGALSGFLFKMISVQMQNKQKLHEMMLNRIKAFDDSSDRAAQREPSQWGQVTRRLIVISVILSVLIFPFLLALIDKPVIVEIQTPVKQWIWGLISTGGKSLFYQLDGFLLIPETRQALLAIIGYYFGQSAMNNK